MSIDYHSLIPLNIRSVYDLLHVKSYVVVKRSYAGVVYKFGDRVPAQVWSLSTDRGSKLRGPSQNRPLVTSKRELNIIKLNPSVKPSAKRKQMIARYNLRGE
ncbi:hypothetical protein AVEN_77339-1 [Araneus ventricosus]|uniref:Uncharacterized protein n=1 Tax=Araneus ventricosus TaxID=182803 RepID=A0A4Y2CB14_ARAVE|nr:hypothetical protein AVEN_77339-1 [Araneus ventricosus]